MEIYYIQSEEKKSVHVYRPVKGRGNILCSIGIYVLNIYYFEIYCIFKHMHICTCIKGAIYLANMKRQALCEWGIWIWKESVLKIEDKYPPQTPTLWTPVQFDDDTFDTSRRSDSKVIWLWGPGVLRYLWWFKQFSNRAFGFEFGKQKFEFKINQKEETG